MRNRNCESCGRTNLPNAKTCSSCGLNLPKLKKSAEYDPLKTVSVGRQEFVEVLSLNKSQSTKSDPKKAPEKSKAKGSNSNILWILGGVGTLVLIGGFFFVTLAATGVYLYTTSGDKEIVQKNHFKEKEDVSDDKETTDKPNEEIKETPKKETPTKFEDFTDSIIKSYIQNYKKRVGVYKLSKVYTPENRYFTGANAEQVATYKPTNARNHVVLINVATYKTVEEAKRFVKNKVAEIKRNGGTVVVHKDKEDSDAVVFNRKGKHGEIIDCIAGNCIAILATSPKHVSGFYKAYFK